MVIERKQLGGNQVTDCPSPKKRTAVPPAFFLDAAALSRLGGGLMLPMLVGRHNALILVLGFISFPHPPLNCAARQRQLQVKPCYLQGTQRIFSLLQQFSFICGQT